MLRSIFVLSPIAFGVLCSGWNAFPVRAEDDRTLNQTIYRVKTPSPGGTGKIYLGREIARVFGHRAAWWLDRPTREAEERPSLVIEILNLRPDSIVADIGTGTGYFTFLISSVVPRGGVIAVDIQPEMLDAVEARAEALGISNVTTVLGEITDPKLPAAHVDLVLMVDAYHEFSHPREMMDGIVASLKNGGRVVLVEYRGEDKASNIKPLHSTLR